jgi:hypothetical protein
VDHLTLAGDLKFDPEAGERGREKPGATSMNRGRTKPSLKLEISEMGVLGTACRASIRFLHPRARIPCENGGASRRHC